MDKEKRLTFKNKAYIGIFIGMFLGIVGPFAIIAVYNEPDKVIYAPWEAADILSYYGTLLGAAATIIAVTLTIYTTNKSAELDRKTSVNIEFRNNGLQICFDLLDALKFSYFAEIINKDEDGSLHPKYIAEEANKLIASISSAVFKFKTYYLNIDETDKETLENFIQWYKEMIVIFTSYPEQRELVMDEIYFIENSLADNYLDLFQINVSEEYNERFVPIEAIIKKAMLTHDFYYDFK